MILAQDPDELFDVVDAGGNLTGIVKRRGDVHRDGDWHRAIHVWVIGVDDPHYYGCDDLPGALESVPSEAFKILLVHSPEIIEKAEAAGIDLYLCGHTHGGQICLPLLGPLISNSNCARKYTRGQWQYKHLQGYTSPGVGTSGVPVRFFCPPELGLIELCCTRHSVNPPTRLGNGNRAVERGQVVNVADLAVVR